MDDKTFGQLVTKGIEAIPEPFRSKIENVAFLIEDEPSSEERKESHLTPNQTLLGLYRGIPQTRRGIHYHAALPDRITIFKKPILGLSNDPKTIKQIVANTVWHEVGHHFGLNEQEIRKRERERRNTEDS